MWWAAGAERGRQAIQDRWCAGLIALNRKKPTQMAIPLQTDSVLKQLVAAMWRAALGADGNIDSNGTLKGVDLES